ncbi:unnamed protein product [Rhizoctonia solani]|uniref:Uncharacterized protein n=1 Tax=Rhizoctonia solani TaxID=456999 RepID=A0A8H2X286_9AGAM|nr:unnamed protein product [Rhizoctonia solani]
MTSEESFTHVSPPSSVEHGSTQRPRSPSSRAPNTQGVTYVRVGRGIVPVSRFDNGASRGRNTAGDLATTSVHSIEGETSPGGTPKQNWFKQVFSRPRHLSFQGSLSRRNTSSTDSSGAPPTPCEVESPVSISSTRLDTNEAGRKLTKSQSRNRLPPTPVSPVQSTNRHNPASTAPPRMAQSMYVQSSGTHDEDGRLLLDLFGVNESPPASPPTTEQAPPQRLPTPEPEPEPEPCVMPLSVRRLPPVPVLNVVPPHDSQDSFAYVFGPNQRAPYLGHRGPAAPPPYIARQSAILDGLKVPTPGAPIPPEPKKEIVLPPVAPLAIRRKGRAQGETGRRAQGFPN